MPTTSSADRAGPRGRAVRTALGALCLSGCLAAARAGAQDTATSAGGTAVHVTTRAGRTRVEVRTASGERYALAVARDASVSPRAQPTGAEVVGAIEGRALVIVDTYPSIPAGLGRCGAGEERFLRVIALGRRTARETLRLKVASCRDDIELATPGLTWTPEPPTLRVDWLQGPCNSAPASRVYRVAPDGTAREVRGPSD